MKKIFFYEARLFFTAMMFFTRLPVPCSIDHSSEYLQRSSKYFSWIDSAWLLRERSRQLFIGYMEIFGDDARFRHRGHEVGVRGPARQGDAALGIEQLHAVAGFTFGGDYNGEQRAFFLPRKFRDIAERCVTAGGELTNDQRGTDGRFGLGGCRRRVRGLFLFWLGSVATHGEV